MKLGGDLAEFGKKRNTDHEFPPPFTWAENNKKIVKTSTFRHQNEIHHRQMPGIIRLSKQKFSMKPRTDRKLTTTTITCLIA